MNSSVPVVGLQELKLCSRCRQPKSLDSFAPCSRTNGVVSACRDCINAANKETRKIWTPEKRREVNFVSHLCRIRRWYGILPEEYDWLLAVQHSQCALCGNIPPKRLHIDHDHAHHENPKQACKECIRGLLCGWCNLYLVPIMEKCLDLPYWMSHSCSGRARSLHAV